MATDFIRTTGVVQVGATVNAYYLSQVWIPGTLGGSTADATDCLTRFRAAWLAMAGKISTAAIVSFNTTVLGYSLLTGKVDSVWNASAAAAFSGSAAGDVLPAQTQGLLRWNTNGIVNGRRIRGRWFIPLPVEADSDANGAPVTAYKTALAAGATALLASPSTPSTPAVYHRASSSSSASVWGITGGTPGPAWSVQRGRR
jgi:hypothetical protein